MSTAYPINTVIVIVAVLLAATLGVWLGLSRGLDLASLPLGHARAWRWAAATALGAWLLVRLGLAIEPPRDSLDFLPVQATSIAFGVIIGVGPMVLSPEFRQVVRRIPQAWLIGVHAIRLEGFLFLALADMQRLPAQFALAAGYGDMLVGLLATITLWALLTHKAYAPGLILAVNGLGLLDFITAFSTGLATLTSFITRLDASGVSTAYLNYVMLVPSFGVPLLAILHIYSLFQLWSPQPTPATLRPSLAELAR
jgi:hypothetical protein